MTLLVIILLVFAFVLTFLAGINVTGSPRVSLGWLGVAAAILALLLLHLPK